MTEQLSAEIELAQDRFLKLQDRDAKNFGYGSTEEGLAIAASCLDRLSTAIAAKLDEPVAARKTVETKTHRVLRELSPDILALATISSVLRGARDDLHTTDVFMAVGQMVNHEAFSEELRLHDEKMHAKVTEWVSKKHGNFKSRLLSARAAAKKAGFSDQAAWESEQVAAVGTFLVSILTNELTDLFVVTGEDDNRRIEVTEGACDIAQAAMQSFVRAHPIFLPSVVPPTPWTDWNKGGPVDPVAQKLGKLVRTRHRETVVAVRRAIKSGQMQPALDALNAVQATPWRINERMLAVMKGLMDLNIAVEGLPRRDNFIVTKVEKAAWEALDDDAKKLHRVKTSAIKTANRALRSDRLRYVEDMETAEALMEHPQFYIPHNLDWRGREYPMTNFHFQREDRVRALFLFADFNAPLGPDGLEWLKIHVANCGDFEKVSKKSYDERGKWTNVNIDLVTAVSKSPLDDLRWTEADKPFLFLAACIELTNALSFGEGYVCSLPASWDGSCSGLQHLSAMTRAEEGRFVNLTDVETPEDVYTTVAIRTQHTIQTSADAGDPIAKLCVSYDGNWRKLVKRNVMTFSYGSGKFGMTTQHMSDLMEPLALEVLQGKRMAHPFGDEWVEQQAASRFLAAHIHAAIEDVVKKPAKAMGFLQDIARVMAHEGKPVEWTTPIGLPWSNRYHESKTRRVGLWLHDKKVKLKLAIGYEKDIDKKRAVNGVAPNFVHACDASHLLMSVNNAAKAGIRHFALVHDSFGAPPAQATLLQRIIRETFVEMYEKHDVLAEVLQQATCDLDEPNTRLTHLCVERGALNIKEVLNAKYAFA